MKQVKLLMMALTILMGMTVTSCMDGGEANTMMEASIPMRVKYNSYIGTTFVSGAIEVVPTVLTSSMTNDLPSNTKIAVVHYRYDTALQPITENTKKLDVDVMSKSQNIDAPLNICQVKEDDSDVESTHAVASLTVASGYSSVSPYILPVMEKMVRPDALAEYFLITPVGYKIKTVQKEDELKPELSKHAFTMVLYMEEIESGETTMVVNLRHVINEGSTTDKVERAMNFAEYKAFDLTAAVAKFKEKSGVNPTKVIVKAMENMSSDELKGGNEKSYELSLKIEE